MGARKLEAQEGRELGHELTHELTVGLTVGDLCRAIEDGRLCPGVENGEYVVRSAEVRQLRWDDQLWHLRAPRADERRPAPRRRHPARAS